MNVAFKMVLIQFWYCQDLDKNPQPLLHLALAFLAEPPEMLDSSLSGLLDFLVLSLVSGEP